MLHVLALCPGKYVQHPHHHLNDCFQRARAQQLHFDTTSQQAEHCRNAGHLSLQDMIQ